MALTPLMIATLVLTTCLGIGGCVITVTCPGPRSYGVMGWDIVMFLVVAGCGYYAIFKRIPREIVWMICLEGFQAAYGVFWCLMSLFIDALVKDIYDMTPAQRVVYDEAMFKVYVWVAAFFVHSIFSGVVAVMYFFVRKQVVNEIALAVEQQMQEQGAGPMGYPMAPPPYGTQSTDQQP